MFLLTFLTGICILILFVSLITLSILGIIFGPILKKYDPEAYSIIYSLFIPSLFLLHYYVRVKQNADKFPIKRRWVLSTLKYSISTFVISFLIAAIGAYIN